MKKLFITAATAILFSVSAFAADGGKKSTTDGGDVKVSYIALNHFNSDFKKVKNVNWTVDANCQKASFMWDGVLMTAFYDLNGAYLGLTQAIDFKSIPLASREEIAANYNGYTVGETIKYEYKGENADIAPLVYFVDLKKGDNELVVKVTPDAAVSFYKQVK